MFPKIFEQIYSINESMREDSRHFEFSGDGFAGSNFGNLQDLERSRTPFHLLCVSIHTFYFGQVLDLQGGKPVLILRNTKSLDLPIELASRFSSTRTP